MYGEDRRRSELARRDILAELCDRFPEGVGEVASPRPGRAWAAVSIDALRPVTEFLLGYDPGAYLSTISAVDTGEEFQAIYHFWVAGTELNLRVKLDRQEPAVPSIMDLHPGANFYEREIHDLMGIEVTGRGKLERLVVPDGWPEGHYPLRKDWPGLPGGESA
jgi:NADH-quinone oxidoreductase subunit C